jgi:hypothetical protein
VGVPYFDHEQHLPATDYHKNRYTISIETKATIWSAAACRRFSDHYAITKPVD